jgi:putative DNA primase/helicase
MAVFAPPDGGGPEQLESPGARAGATGDNALKKASAHFRNVAQDRRDNNRDMALSLARAGLPVFPCAPDKRPLVRWKDIAGAGLADVADFWQRHPGAMVGLPTGAASGVYVVDLDVDKATGERIGEASLEALGIGHLLTDPAQPRVRTPSGGLHLLFRHPGPGFGNTAGKLGPKIDTRGEAGYVIAPGTVTPKGRYTPEASIDWRNLPPLPEALRAALAAPQRPAEPPSAPANGGAANGWGQAALAGELARLLAAPVGQRNHALNRTAFRLAQAAAAGTLDATEAQTRLRAAALSIGLSPQEVEATVASGWQAGLESPRGPEPRSAMNGAAHGAAGTTKPATAAATAARPNDDDALDLTHDGLALSLGAAGWDRDARHVALWGRWLFWTGTRWERDDTLAHMTRARAFLRRKADDLTAWAERKAATLAPDAAEKLLRWAEKQADSLRHKATVAAVVDLARSNPSSAAGAEDFDRDRLLLGTPGGTVDLRTGTLRPARREDMITKSTTVAPAHGRPARWLRFLHEVLDGDTDLIAFMQRAAGYALTGETRAHKMLFLYGTGRNGKSVFLDVLTHIWGDYARRVPATTFLHTQGEKHPTDIASLAGARLAVSSELPRGKTWDESVIKDLTGGDRMTARFMRQDFFEFDPQLTLMVAGNSQPSFRGVDEAIRARVVLVPFTVTIPPERRDPHLADKLKAEAPQILGWAIEGALEWQRRGLDVPAKVAAASASYFDDEDLIGQFLADEVERVFGAFASAGDLHQRFTQWAEAQGLSPWTQNTLIKELRARGFTDAKSNGRRGLKGLRLR